MALSDFPYSFAPQPIIDPTTNTLVVNADGGKVVDPATGNPLTMADLNGNPTDKIGGSPFGTSQWFRSTQLAVLVLYGDVAVQCVATELFPIASRYPELVAAASSAQTAAQQALADLRDAIAQGVGNPGGGGLPADVTLEDIPNGVTRIAMTQAERDKLSKTPTTFLKVGAAATDAKAGNYAPTAADVGAVTSMTGDVRLWTKRTTAQGPPTEAEGAKRGTDYVFLDVV